MLLAKGPRAPCRGQQLLQERGHPKPQPHSCEYPGKTRILLQQSSALQPSKPQAEQQPVVNPSVSLTNTPRSSVGICSSLCASRQAGEGTTQPTRVSGAEPRGQPSHFYITWGNLQQQSFFFLEISQDREFWSWFLQSRLALGYRRDGCHVMLCCLRAPGLQLGPES